VERREPSSLPQAKYVRYEETSVAMEDPLHQTIIKKEDPKHNSLFTERFQCPHCNFIATSHPELFTHVTYCAKEPQDGCPLCPEGAGLSVAAVDDHIMSVHVGQGELQKSDDGSYHCKKCNKVFKSFSHLKRHIVTFKHQGMERCSSCGINLSLKNMEAHQKEFHGQFGSSFICQV